MGHHLCWDGVLHSWDTLALQRGQYLLHCSPDTSTAFVHVPVRIGDDLDISLDLKAVEHDPRRFGHALPHPRNTVVQDVEWGDDEEGIMHRGHHLDTALCAEAGRKTHHLRAGCLD